MKPWIFSLVLFLPLAAQAADERIRFEPYEDGKIVTLKGCTNYQTVISFGPDERIENVAVGDSQTWQVTPNKAGEYLFVKPVTAYATTNMTVITNQRRYNFDLLQASSSACADGKVDYELRFTYAPPPPKNEPTAPISLLPAIEKRNAAYSYDGDRNLVPLRVFDDGYATYMIWPEGVSVPAVFVIADDGSEGLVNFANREDYMVVDLTASAFVLRSGDQKVTLYNDAFVRKGLDDQSPKSRSPEIGKPQKKKGWLW